MPFADEELSGLPRMKPVMACLLLSALAQATCVVGRSTALALCLAGAYGAYGAGTDDIAGTGGGAGSAAPSLFGFGVDAPDLPACLAAFALFFVGGQALACIQDACVARYARHRAAELRAALLERVFSGAFACAARAGTANIVTAALEGTDRVERYLRLALPRAAALAGGAVPLLLVVLPVSVFTRQPVCFAILLACFPVIVFFMVLLGRTAREQARARHADMERMTRAFGDAVAGLDTLDALGATKREGRRVFSTSERLRTSTVETLKTATLSGAVLDLVATLGTAGVAMMLALAVMDDAAQLPAAFLVLLLAPECLAPLRAFASDFHATLDGRNALAAIRAMLARDARADEGGAAVGDAAPGEGKGTAPLPGEGKDPAGQSFAGGARTGEGEIPAEGVAVGEGTPAPDAFSAGEGEVAGVQSACGDDGAGAVHAGEGKAPGGDARPPEGEGAAPLPARPLSAGPPPCCPSPAAPLLVARGLSFTHEGSEKPALSGLDFTLHEGERVAVVGGSGSGKSTLLALLSGLVRPGAGALELDGAPLAGRELDAWRGRLLYIPQAPHIFCASLRDNIAFYAPGADEAAVERAVEAMGLSELVAQLPCGLDTQVGDGARALSGGQARRVAFARVLLDDSRRVLLLDEPTEHLDIETEYELKQRVLPLMEGRLVVLATHRLHWLADVDRVLVLEGGRLVEQGVPAELLVRDGSLARLVASMRGGES